MPVTVPGTTHRARSGRNQVRRSGPLRFPPPHSDIGEDTACNILKSVTFLSLTKEVLNTCHEKTGFYVVRHILGPNTMA